jgi:epoxyqueuosine reductase
MSPDPGEVRRKARELGFELYGVAGPGPYPEQARLAEWLKRGFAGTMTWMHRSASRRADVRRLLPSARSVIVTGTVYNVGRRSEVPGSLPDRALISRYAWGDDYHDVIGRRLDALVTWMRDTFEGPLEARTMVDSGPVQERVFARRAGLGWIGKNTCLIHPRFGSWVFLGVIVTNASIEPDAVIPNRCGTCTACLDACPTGALIEPGLLDARRCLAYLTIEHRGLIPAAFRRLAGRHLFGCDICQDVCPWNARAVVSQSPHWRPREGLASPPLESLLRLSDDDLAALIAGTALERAGVAGLRRNLVVAAENAQTAG